MGLIIVHYHHTDNKENDFLILGEESTFGIKENFGSPEKIWESKVLLAFTL